MNEGYTKKQLVELFQSESLPILEKGFREVLEKHQESISNILKTSTSFLENGDKEKSLEILKSLSELPSVELNKEWINIVNSSISELPETVKLPQDESHYSSREGDSFFISIGKSLKKAKRGIYTGSSSFQNVFLKGLNKPVKEIAVATRIVPFRRLIEFYLYKNTNISKWNNAYHRLVSVILNKAQLSTLDSLTSNANDEGKELLNSFSIDLASTFDTQTEELELFLTKLTSEVSNTINLVGTLELSELKFSSEIIQKNKGLFETKLESNISNWAVLKSSLSNRVELVIQLLGLERNLDGRTHTLKTQLDTFFLDKLTKPQEIIHKEIVQCISAFEELKKPTKKQLSELCDNIKISLNELISTQGIEVLASSVDSALLSSYLEEYVSGIPRLSNSQPEKTEFVKEIELSEEIPKFSLKEVDWQRFLKRMLGEYLAGELAPNKVKPEEFIVKLVGLYSEIIQIIETNLEVVEEVTLKEEETPVSVAQEGLERAQLKLEELSSLIIEKKDELSSLLISKNDELFNRLADFLIKQDLSEMKWVEAQLMVKESAGDWRTKFTVFWAKFVDRFYLAQRFLTIRYNEYSTIVRKFFGIEEVEGKKGANTTLATFLFETDKKFAELPFIYRRLFDFHRDVESSFFIRNSTDFEKCRRALELWKGGFPASISIVGEKGSGKTTLTRLFQEEVFTDEKIHKLHFLSTVSTESEIVNIISKMLALGTNNSVDELIKKINKNRKGTVFIVENIQNCFLRNMNGYEALQALLFIITETKKDVFWVMTASRYSWNFLNVVFKTGEYFSHSIETDNLTDAEVETVIMNRQKASGYQLRFEADFSTLKSRAYKKYLDDDEAAQNYLQTIFFEKLTKVAEGNSTVAMIFWIRAIRDFSDSHFTIEPFNSSATQQLDSLDSLSLFALNAFILHDTLCAKELALAINSSERECQLIISRLSSRGILVQNVDLEYTLNDLIYRQIVRILKIRNILH